MDNTSLHVRIWIRSADGFRKACKAIHREYQNIIDAAIFQFIENAKPDF